ncbi:unnamed protein product [Rhizophagus irregularis]|nr:unnamed protein product [Rhizophagus irregularis]
MIPIHPELLVSDGRTRSVFTCKINNIFQDYATTYRTSYIKFKVNDDSYSIRLFPQLNENTYGRIDDAMNDWASDKTNKSTSKSLPIKLNKQKQQRFQEETPDEGSKRRQGRNGRRNKSISLKRGRTIKLFDHFTESFLLNHKVIELLAESSEYIGAFQPTDSNG